MLRSVFYRELGAVSPDELLMLLVVAWGGQPAGPPSPALQATIHELLRFAVGVMRAPAFPAEEEPCEEEPLPAPASGTAPVSAVALHREPRADQPSLQDAAHSAPIRRESILQRAGSTELEKIDSAIQLLAIRSPDVKRYLELLRYREVQLRIDQERVAERASESPSSSASARLSAASSFGSAAGLPRYDPWDENSEFQVELRRFAAEREARLAAHPARHKPAPGSGKITEAAEAAWHRLLGKRRLT